MIVDCPHCYAKVMPRADGQCPACNKNVEDATGADLTKAPLTVFESDEFPPVCFLCGQSTDRAVEHRFDEKVNKSALGWTAFGLLFLSPVKLIEGLNGLWFRKHLSISLPQCENCSGPVLPRRVELEGGEIDLLVHRKFRDEVRTFRTKLKEA